jgi:putative FmdB family regulatory protein
VAAAGARADRVVACAAPPYHRAVPIYEYLCEECGRISEVMQKMTDPAPRQCPECGSAKIAKLVSRSAFQLKGGGWYADLYASKKEAKGDAAKPAEKKDAAAAPPAKDAAAPAAKEAKPAAAPAAAPAKKEGA